MYKHIAQHRPTLDIYRDAVVSGNFIPEADLDKMNQEILDEFETAFQNAPDYQEGSGEWLESRWAGFKKMGQEGVQLENSQGTCAYGNNAG